MRRRSITGGKVNGTPTVDPPTPQAIDDYTGFKVPLSSLKKDWQGLLTQSPDRRNPQDFLRGIKDNMALPISRPEPSAEYVAMPIVWQDGTTFMTQQATGSALLTQGVDPMDTF